MTFLIVRSEIAFYFIRGLLTKKQRKNMFPHAFLLFGLRVMKVANSLKTLKTRDRNCRVVRRKGRVYVINKANPRFKARQG